MDIYNVAVDIITVIEISSTNHKGARYKTEHKNEKEGNLCQSLLHTDERQDFMLAFRLVITEVASESANSTPESVHAAGDFNCKTELKLSSLNNRLSESAAWKSYDPLS